MRLTRFAPFVLALALPACLPPHPPPAPPPPEVSPQSAVVALGQLSPAIVARYLGTFRSAGNRLTFRRIGDRLYADHDGRADATPLSFVGLGTFADAMGTAYLFMPPDGSGGTLRTLAPDGTSRDWVR